MKLLSTLAASLVLVGASLGSAGTFAQPPAEMTSGEVRKIDKEAGKITIKHGEIKNLEMPPMTMVFTIKDPALLEKIKPGDKVKFNVVKEDGKIVIKDIQASP
jgi:Cu/Ag efflux protein CusF